MKLIDNTYPRSEKLKKSKDIERLFKEGQSVPNAALRLVYLHSNDGGRFGVSVSKKLFKNSVDRNRIKRLLRECYRLNKPEILAAFPSGFPMAMLIYVGKEIPETRALQIQFKKLLQKIKAP